MNKDHLYFNAFAQIQEIGSVRFRKLLNFFPDLGRAWTASSGELRQAGLEEHIVNKILESRRQLDPEKEFAKLEKNQVKLLTIRDQAYPKLLKEIYNPPVVLYLKGEILPQDEMAIAVVGTRKFSAYGKQVVEDLVQNLISAGLTVVSGLALGLDALAHRQALESGGRTIAVLGCGLDAVYPASNRVIAERILAGNGALISELPLGMPPLKHHFPHRNRIISGLALGTVVIEAARDSGTLITARHALEQNREVFAVPGPIFSPVSAGTNNLIKMGAKVVTGVSDILEELNLGFLEEQIKTQEIVADTQEEGLILKLLSREPVHIDAITKAAGLSASTVASTLTIMEMKGKVRNLGANQYVLGR